MAEKNSWHRYDMKELRHCHPMYILIIGGGVQPWPARGGANKISSTSAIDGTTGKFNHCPVLTRHDKII